MRIVSAGESCVANPINPVEAFRGEPGFVGKAQPVSPRDRTAILRALSCTSTDETRHVLQGVYFENEANTPQVVGTDGRCLYHEKLRDLVVEKPLHSPSLAGSQLAGFWR